MQKELGEKKFYSQFYLFSKLQKFAKMTKKWRFFGMFGQNRPRIRLVHYLFNTGIRKTLFSVNLHEVGRR